MDILLFALATVGVILIPGPNVILIVSTSISAGKRRGLQTALGTSSAMVIQLLIAAPSLGWILAKLTAGYLWIKWVGVIYLLGILVASFRMYRQNKKVELSGVGSLSRGFILGITNPKTILFFCAFAPQFISSKDNYNGDIFILSAVFWSLVFVRDMVYASLSHKVAKFIKAFN